MKREHAKRMREICSEMVKLLSFAGDNIDSSDEEVRSDAHGVLVVACLHMLVVHPVVDDLAQRAHELLEKEEKKEDSPATVKVEVPVSGTIS